ncbi:hypothetical protein OROGR_007205 [Orobanche gracilis]
MGSRNNEEKEALPPLFETTGTAKGRSLYKLFCLVVLFGIVLIWVYRLIHIPGKGERGRYAWLSMLFSEVLFGLYWIITQSARWRLVYRHPFKDRLSARYKKDKLPRVDIYVCTADHTLEPPSLVINTILSVMSYNYPPDRLGILIDGWNPKSVDMEGNRLPTLVYLSREKKPGWAHNFKAGSMNALIRVSSRISNAPIILNLDCDMYSNDPDAINDALCFFLDEKKGKQISYVQYPQRFSNITKNDVYANTACATFQIELAGIDGFGGALYIGTGCFHRRESLSGKYYENRGIEWDNVDDNTKGRTVEQLEVASKALADCSYEKGTLWGKEMGLVYGGSVEDIVTGLTIQCRGWKPVYYNPTKNNAFQGIGPTTLDVALFQFKRWCEGLFQIFTSNYCPFVYGHGKISLGAQMGYCIYLLWAPISLPTLCYAVVPALYLLHDVPLFPESTTCSLVEDLTCGGTLRGWWNLQRMWLFRRITSYFFALIDTIYRQLGLSETSFDVTDKVMDDEARTRYENEMVEFGSSSVMFVMIATIALLNLFGLGYGFKRVCFSGGEAWGQFATQMSICGMIAMVNLPVYEALFFRRDKGRIPFSVLVKSFGSASMVCLVPI